ncbi:MAG TPA: phosphatase PAP2 family protein [Mycobacterium sp.]|nr:phosphatase PAP2 family protein [Mycobacterium sp.]
MASRNGRSIAGAAAAAVLYALMWIGFTQHWALLAAVDDWLLRVFHDVGSAHPGWVRFWDVFCVALGPTAFRIVAFGLIVLAVVRRNLSTAVFLFISVELMGLVTEAGKRLSDRPRPSSALVDAVSTSFPSGHALGVMVGVLALLTVLWPVMPVRLRVPVAVVGAGLVFLVGFARVILNVHHPSDVVAGWALGYLYYLLCVRLVPPRPLTSAVETPAELDTVP